MRSVAAVLALACAAVAAAGASKRDAGAAKAVHEFEAWAAANGCRMHPSLRVDAQRPSKAIKASPEVAAPENLVWRVVTREPEEEGGHVDPVFPEDDMSACDAKAILMAPIPGLLDKAGDAPVGRSNATRELLDLGFTGEDLLALELLYHKSLGGRASTHALLKTFPPSKELNALYMGAAEEAVLKGTAVGSAVERTQQSFAEFQRRVSENVDAVRAAFPMGDPAALLLSHVAADPAQAESDAEDMSLLGDDQLRWASAMVMKFGRRVSTGLEEVGSIPCIVPLLHMFNHAAGVRTAYSITRKGFKVTHMGPSHQPRGSEEAAKPGKEVFVNFVPKRWNADLLSQHGQVTTSEVHSALNIRTSNPQESDPKHKHAAARIRELLRILELDDSVLISPMGISTAALNVARMRSLGEGAFVRKGLVILARLNNAREFDDSWDPNEEKMAADPQYAARVLAWVLGSNSLASHELPKTDGDALDDGDAAAGALASINAKTAGLRVPLDVEKRAVEGLLQALRLLREHSFGAGSAADDAELLQNWKLTKRARHQMPGAKPRSPPSASPSSGPRLLREAVRARMQERLAVEAAIADGEARVAAIENGAVEPGGVGWSADLLDAHVSRKPTATEEAGTDSYGTPAKSEWFASATPQANSPARPVEVKPNGDADMSEAPAPRPAVPQR
ncbi:hypothetical protein FNF28_01876 [Cafeteria roenbergensis]|uniref:SET domain-containing protein n=1 Tax=Cafeteria roenbergensis TaxID=33653 RepID=A0A5A8DYT4_CAFRO|nr:hypothetical protein FNF28_01876 [Cafeteria roenbergensis]